MQGRLTPSRGRGIQFFPFGEWKEEFRIGAEIGINEIEWIFDHDRYEENPIWNENGRGEIREAIEATGVAVKSVCFDYFMRRPFYKGKGTHEENLALFTQVVKGMADIGASLIEIPMVDDSSVRNSEEREKAIMMAREMADIATGYDVAVGFETDMPPGTFEQFLRDIGRDNIGANYDSGNSSGLGYDAEEELSSLGSLVLNVHIKDRVFGGTTVRLGTGSADFNKVFSALRNAGYSGSFILQAARGEDGKEKDAIREQMEFVKRYISLHGIGA